MNIDVNDSLTTLIPTPTTIPPTTLLPTTVPPITIAPTTIVPTTVMPTTIPPPTMVPTSIIPSTLTPSVLCDDNKVLVILERFYSTDASEEQFKFYEGITTDDLIYEELFIGITKETTLCVESTVHKLILIDSGGNGWSIGSKLIISSESGVLGEFTLSGGSSLEILIHPIIRIINETPISSCSELENLHLNATSLVMESNACSSNSVTVFNLTGFDNLDLIDIGDDNLMYVNRFVIDELNHLNTLKIGMNSFTKEKNSWRNDPSRSFHLLNCDELESIEIDRYSFSDYSGGF